MTSLPLAIVCLITLAVGWLVGRGVRLRQERLAAAAARRSGLAKLARFHAERDGPYDRTRLMTLAELQAARHG